eukprot:797157-Pelagomonas_calceolata.AAC.2
MVCERACSLREGSGGCGVRATACCVLDECVVVCAKACVHVGVGVGGWVSCAMNMHASVCKFTGLGCLSD